MEINKIAAENEKKLPSILLIDIDDRKRYAERTSMSLHRLSFDCQSTALTQKEYRRVLIGRRNFKEHLPWIILILVLSVLSIIWYLSYLAGTSWELRPTGSKGPLFLFGIAGGAICLFEFLLWPRKHFRVWRIGRVKVWMRAHIWLGLLSVPLLILHSGFHFKNLEATILFVLFGVVIVSGIWGLMMQQFLPQKMLDEIPAETIYSQIDHMSRLLAEEAEHVVIATCGLPDKEDEKKAVLGTPTEGSPIASQAHLTIGAVRVVGGIRGKVVETRAEMPFVEGTDGLREYFLSTVKPYLLQGKESGSILASVRQSEDVFNGLRQEYPAAAETAINDLESLCDQRRQFDRQKKLHLWLHNWLWIHLPLSIALIVLMFVHIWKTLQYGWPS